MKIPGAGKVELVYTADDGTETRELVHEFDGPGIVQGVHNVEKSIRSFAHSCFKYALDTKQEMCIRDRQVEEEQVAMLFKMLM